MKYSGFQLGHPEITLPPVIGVQSNGADRAWRFGQRLVSGLALALLSPLIGLIYVLVKTTSRGPFLFAQERRGLNGATFKVYKVRTMRPGSERSTALGTTHSNPSVTAVGRALRQLKLDELPQLWNVLCGDMALVGPRPIPMALDSELRKKIPGFEKRYEVRPGLSSLGQICVKDNALGDKLVEDWKLRFTGEMHYVRSRGVRYDILIIMMTVLYVFKILIRK